MLGDGHRVQAGHVGDPHPFADGRIEVSGGWLATRGSEIRPVVHAA